MKAIALRCVLAPALCVLVAMQPPRASAYTPDDPVVQGMVSKGLRFIEQSKVNDPGEAVLCAYAHFKAEHDESNPVVQRGIAEAKKFAGTLSQTHAHKANYEAAVSVMLLAEVGATRFRSELANLQRYYQEVQFPHGGFGYHGETLGDVSQTQYATLALWTLDRAGLKMDPNQALNVIKWLLQVQDKDGPWPYKGEIPRTGGLIDQKQATFSMALAGGSSLMIAGDALRAWGNTQLDDTPSIIGMPKAVKVYKEDANAGRRKTAKVDKTRVLNSVRFANAWRKANPERKGGNLYWYFYSVYTIERFESFLEVAEGRKSDPSPAWYNSLVNELKGMQGADGGWSDRAHSSPPVSTAFAVLFLIRSTKKSLGSGASAATIGGQGFGADVSKSKLVGGKATTQAPARAVTDMLSLLEGDDADELDGKAMADSAVLATNPTERAAQLDRLERLVRGSKSYQARRVSAKLLGMSDELRVVPALIFALSDPDTPVRRYARDGLRFISRKFDGFGMPDKPNNTELRKAQRAWRAWYRTMRPGYVFLDEEF